MAAGIQAIWKDHFERLQRHGKLVVSVDAGQLQTVAHDECVVDGQIKDRAEKEVLGAAQHAHDEDGCGRPR